MTVPVAPIRIDKPLRRGAELRIRHNVKTASGAAQDITGATFTANIRVAEAKDSTIVFTLTQTIVSTASGIIDFSLAPSQTDDLAPGLDYWVSVWCSATFTGNVDHLEVHGKLDILG